MAELADNSHTLPAGALVQVFVLVGRKGGKSYAFHLPARQPAVVVKISGGAAGAGEYTGAILTGNSAATAAADLAMPAGLGVPADDAIVLNVEEDGITGHRLAAGTYAVGVVRGFTNETPPKKIVVVRGGVGRTNSATTVGAATEGSESADGASWSRAANGTPVTVYAVSRVVYNDAGDQKLYAFIRALSFDARGLMISAGAETRVTVDATEACS